MKQNKSRLSVAVPTVFSSMPRPSKARQLCAWHHAASLQAEKAACQCCAPLTPLSAAHSHMDAFGVEASLSIPSSSQGHLQPQAVGTAQTAGLVSCQECRTRA